MNYSTSGEYGLYLRLVIINIFSYPCIYDMKFNFSSFCLRFHCICIFLIRMNLFINIFAFGQGFSISYRFSSYILLFSFKEFRDPDPEYRWADVECKNEIGYSYKSKKDTCAYLTHERIQPLGNKVAMSTAGSASKKIRFSEDKAKEQRENYCSKCEPEDHLPDPYFGKIEKIEAYCGNYCGNEKSSETKYCSG